MFYFKIRFYKQQQKLKIFKYIRPRFEIDSFEFRLFHSDMERLKNLLFFYFVFISLIITVYTLT